MKNMKKWSLIALLAVSLIGTGLLTAKLHGNASEGQAMGYTCPVTGDTLPCPSCCPFK